MDTSPNMLTRGFEQLLGRLSGPLNFRLVIMPTVVTVLALRGVWKDFREGRPAFLGVWIKDPVERSRVFRSALKDIGKIFVMATVLDITYQVWVFRWVYPGQVLIVAVVCAVVPYVLVRGPVALIVRTVYRMARQES